MDAAPRAALGVGVAARPAVHVALVAGTRTRAPFVVRQPDFGATGGVPVAPQIDPRAVPHAARTRRRSEPGDDAVRLPRAATPDRRRASQTVDRPASRRARCRARV